MLVLISACSYLLLFWQTITLHGNLLQSSQSGDTDGKLLAAPLHHKFSVPTAGHTNDEHVVRHNPFNRSATWDPALLIGAKKKILKNIVEKSERWQWIQDTFLPKGVYNTAHPVKTDKSMSMLGFLRVPKTGSTSVLTWAAAARKMGSHFECFFGSLDQNSELPSPFFEQHLLDCPHRTYEDTVLEWAVDVLPKVIDGEPHHNGVSTKGQEQRRRRTRPRDFSLRIFTMLRDPFDRLVSYFQYVHRIYPVWSYMSTPEQNATILANNMTGWMHLLATQPSKAFHLPYQKDAMIEANFSIATELIQGSSPRVFTVIQECFEASVLLLTETFPEFFSASATQSFLNSSNTKHNTKSRFQTRDQEGLCRLRQMAEIWFADDFQFYDTALEQFRHRLARSSVDSKVIQDCFRILDGRPPCKNK